jgi:hypothetical protein
MHDDRSTAKLLEEDLRATVRLRQPTIHLRRRGHQRIAFLKADSIRTRSKKIAASRLVCACRKRPIESKSASVLFTKEESDAMSLSVV